MLIDIPLQKDQDVNRNKESDYFSYQWISLKLIFRQQNKSSKLCNNCIAFCTDYPTQGN